MGNGGQRPEARRECSQNNCAQQKYFRRDYTRLCIIVRRLLRKFLRTGAKQIAVHVLHELSKLVVVVVSGRSTPYPALLDFLLYFVNLIICPNEWNECEICRVVSHWELSQWDPGRSGSHLPGFLLGVGMG